MVYIYKVTEIEELSTKVLRRVHRFHGPDEAEIYKEKMSRPGKWITVRREKSVGVAV